VADEKGKDRLVAHYSRRKGLKGELEQGVAVFDDKEAFEPAAQLPLEETWRRPSGHPIVHQEGKTKWLRFGSPAANLRVPATLDAVLDPKRYEAFTCSRDAKLSGPEVGKDGKPVWRWQKELLPVGSATESKWVKAQELKPEHARFLPADTSAPED